jgi:uncharacterized protein with FMN-binding domain
MKKRYKILIIFTIILLVIGIASLIIINQIEKNLEEVMAIEITDIDLSLMSDGTYEGSYKATPIEVEVRVVVEDHVIQSIDIMKHISGQGQDGELIVEDVLIYQSLDVDLISGATYSSKIILLAILDALS